MPCVWFSVQRMCTAAAVACGEHHTDTLLSAKWRLVVWRRCRERSLLAEWFKDSLCMWVRCWLYQTRHICVSDPPMSRLIVLPVWVVLFHVLFLPFLPVKRLCRFSFFLHLLLLLLEAHTCIQKARHVFVWVLTRLSVLMAVCGHVCVCMR